MALPPNCAKLITLNKFIGRHKMLRAINAQSTIVIRAEAALCNQIARLQIIKWYTANWNLRAAITRSQPGSWTLRGKLSVPLVRGIKRICTHGVDPTRFLLSLTHIIHCAHRVSCIHNARIHSGWRLSALIMQRRIAALNNKWLERDWQRERASSSLQSSHYYMYAVKYQTSGSLIGSQLLPQLGWKALTTAYNEWPRERPSWYILHHDVLHYSN
jgi:hypothetical protein